MMSRTLFVLLLLVCCLHFLHVECRKKKGRSKFSFDSLLSGLDGEEKEMFKEELEKEVKKFRKLFKISTKLFKSFAIWLKVSQALFPDTLYIRTVMLLDYVRPCLTYLAYK